MIVMALSHEDRARLVADPQEFAAPGELVGVHRERFLLALLSTEDPHIPSPVQHIGSSMFSYSRKVITTCINRRGSVDLSLVRRRQAPVLIDHIHDLAHTVGIVERAWIRDGKLWGVLRLGRSRAATEIWEMLEDGLPVSISAGYRTLCFERLDDVGGTPHFRVTERRLMEVSIVMRGADEHARVVAHGRTMEDLASDPMVRPPRPGAAVNAKAWRRWTIPAARRMAEQVGCDADRLAVELSAEVERHLEELADAIAA